MAKAFFNKSIKNFGKRHGVELVIEIAGVRFSLHRHREALQQRRAVALHQHRFAVLLSVHERHI
jgi:hypothetical protein